MIPPWEMCMPIIQRDNRLQFVPIAWAFFIHKMQKKNERKREKDKLWQEFWFTHLDVCDKFTSSHRIDYNRIVHYLFIGYVTWRVALNRLARSFSLARSPIYNLLPGRAVGSFLSGGIHAAILFVTSLNLVGQSSSGCCYAIHKAKMIIR